MQLISTAAGPPFSGRLHAIAFALGEVPRLRVIPLSIGKDGRAEITGLAPGRYRLTFRRPGQSTGESSVEIEVREGKTEPIRVRLAD